ncbi:MAG: hypothetical protein JWN56_1927 [Sphingobacteriales bacterium]|nr:hypothetical protein [Sphingobacteriales bacterium]
MLNINLKYTIATLLLFLIEVLIAVFAHDHFIRPYVGDFLVVILIYCFVKSFVSTPTVSTAICVLVFSYVVETLQYFRIVHYLGLDQSKIANILIGNYFTWVDILAYTLGIAFVIVIEKLRLSSYKRTSSNTVRTEEILHFFI